MRTKWNLFLLVQPLLTFSLHFGTLESWAILLIHELGCCTYFKLLKLDSLGTELLAIHSSNELLSHSCSEGDRSRTLLTLSKPPTTEIYVPRSPTSFVLR